MKNTIKLFGILLVVFGVFVALGSVSASQADELQPAVPGEIRYDDLGAIKATTLRVGDAGEGGVTFFNGSIENEDGPVVIADDINIWGEIWRGEKGGDPLKISDHVVPTMNNTNDMGSTNKRWRNIYSVDGDFSRTLSADRLHAASGDFSGNLDADQLYARESIQTPLLVANGIQFNDGDSSVGSIGTGYPMEDLYISTHGPNRKVTIEAGSGGVSLYDFAHVGHGGIIFSQVWGSDIPTCNSSNYGRIIFSADDLGQGGDAFYVCDSLGGGSWRVL